MSYATLFATLRCLPHNLALTSTNITNNPSRARFALAPIDDVGKNVGKIFDKNNKDDGSSTEPEDEEDGDEDEGEDGAGGMDEERKIMLRKDIAMEQMMYFLDTLEPIVNKLEELFNDLNMNDPTVV